MTKLLRGLIFSARLSIIEYLGKYRSTSRRELEPIVLSCINVRTKRNGTIIHKTLPIHGLAFIMAYKELENENKIKLTRPKDVPFPATDFETVFAISVSEV